MAQVTYRGIKYNTNDKKQTKTNKVQETYRGVKFEKDLATAQYQFLIYKEHLLTDALFLCKMPKYHIKIMEPQREQLKLRLRQVELALDALKAEIYSDVDAYSTVNTANKVLTDYDEIFEDDDG